MTKQELQVRQEQWQLLLSEMLVCENCPWKSVKKQTVPPEGPLDAELIIYGRNPGVDENKHGLPFVGRGGDGLNKFLGSVPIPRNRVIISNTAKCYGGHGDPQPTEEVYNACSPWIARELEIVKPKLIITLGNDALRRIAGFSQSSAHFQGEVLELRHFPYPVFVLTHPGWWVRQSKYIDETLIPTVAPKLRAALERYEVKF